MKPLSVVSERRQSGIAEGSRSDEFAARSMEVLIRTAVHRSDLAAEPITIKTEWVKARPKQFTEAATTLTAEGMRAMAAWTDGAFKNSIEATRPEPEIGDGITIDSTSASPTFILATDASVTPAILPSPRGAAPTARGIGLRERIEEEEASLRQLIAGQGEALIWVHWHDSGWCLCFARGSAAGAQLSMAKLAASHDASNGGHVSDAHMVQVNNAIRSRRGLAEEVLPIEAGGSMNLLSVQACMWQLAEDRKNGERRVIAPRTRDPMNTFTTAAASLLTQGSRVRPGTRLEGGSSGRASRTMGWGREARARAGDTRRATTAPPATRRGRGHLDARIASYGNRR